MKILFYCPFNFNLKSKNLDKLGGIETLNFELAIKLSNFNHEIFLATHSEKTIKKNKIYNIPIKELFYKNHNFDLIISSNNSKIFNHFKNSRKILWLHNTLAIEKAIRRGFLFPIIFNKVNALFVSKYLNKNTSFFYLFNKRKVLPNFLPAKFERVKKNYDREKIFVWSVQREKGLQQVLNLWSEKIFTKRNDIKLYIYGIEKKKFRNKLRYYQKLNIFFFDRVPKQKLKNIYNKSLAMICLGYDETFCLNALEANACGLPILTFGKTALYDFTINKKNGFLVDNFDDLGNKILDLSKSNINKDITNYCYNNSKKFYLDKIIFKWLKLIKD
jgi:glycosyltransferase involved in cell wall biosynthesis